MQQYQLTDAFGRLHDYLRISLTDACNLRCNYCMPEMAFPVTPAKGLMQPDEIFSIARTFVDLGIRKIRLTGGEPLVRKDAAEIILKLSELPVELCISTNAVLVHNYIDVFRNSGIKSVNVSLDTLDEEQFLQITKRGDFNVIKQNIFHLLDNSFQVKLNCVVMKGINEDVIFDFAKLTEKYPLQVRFIEFMPFSGNSWKKDRVITESEMLDLLSNQYTLEKLTDLKNDTDKKYKIAGHTGSIGFISTVSNPFCEGCNRLRLTADGKLKNCLFSPGETDLLNAYRNGIDLQNLIINNLKAKRKALGGRNDFENIENRSMVKIGG